MGRTKATPDARRALDFLKSSNLVNLDMSISELTDSVSRLEEVAGYVIAWEKYVLVVGEQELTTVINE